MLLFKIKDPVIPAGFSRIFSRRTMFRRSNPETEHCLSAKYCWFIAWGRVTTITALVRDLRFCDKRPWRSSRSRTLRESHVRFGYKSLSIYDPNLGLCHPLPAFVDVLRGKRLIQMRRPKIWRNDNQFTFFCIPDRSQGDISQFSSFQLSPAPFGIVTPIPTAALPANIACQMRASRVLTRAGNVRVTANRVRPK